MCQYLFHATPLDARPTQLLGKIDKAVLQSMRKSVAMLKQKVLTDLLNPVTLFMKKYTIKTNE